MQLSTLIRLSEIRNVVAREKERMLLHFVEDAQCSSKTMFLQLLENSFLSEASALCSF